MARIRSILPVSELTAEREAGVGRVRDQSALANKFHHLADRPPLRILRMYVEIPRHNRRA